MSSLFIAIAGAAVVLSDNSVDAAAPTVDFSGATTVTVDGIEDFGATNGTVTVGNTTIYNITKDIGSATSPVDLAFILNDDVQFTTNNGSKIYIQNDHQNATFMFTTEGDVLEFNGIEAYLDSNVASSSVFNMNINDVNGAVSVINGAVINVTTTQGNSTWMGAEDQITKSSYLIVTGSSAKASVVNFNNANSLQEVVITSTYGEINFNDSKYTGVVLKDGTTLSNSSVAVNGAGYSGLQFNGTVTLENSSSITVSGTGSNSDGHNYAGISVQKDGAELKIDGTSSVDTNSIGFLSSTSNAKISGEGTFSGNFVKGLNTGDAKDIKFTLDETKFTGTNSVSGISIDGEYTIMEKSALNVSSDAILAGTATNNGSISINSGANVDNFKISNDSTGTVNITGTSTAVLGGTIDSTSKNTEFGIGQIVDVVDNLVIDGATVTINGILNNSDGYSIDIINGGKLIIGGALATFTNDGAITVEATDSAIAAGSESIQIIDGAKFVNNGTVMLESSTETASYLMSNSGIIDNNGTIEIVDGVMSNNGTINNKAGAVFTISGTFTAGAVSTFNNSGSVVVNGTISGNGATIGNVAEGATVTVSNVTGKITVSDSNLESKRTLETGNNTIALNSTNTTESVGGVIITSAVVEVEKKYYKEMQISGTFDVSLLETDANGTGIANVSNFYVDASRAVVSDNLNLGDNLNVQFTSNTKFYVAGNMNITDAGSAKFQNGNVYVTGMIVSVDEISGAKVNAAMYNALVGTQKTYYYTTLDKAIEGASSANVNRIEILNQVTLDVDATVPSGITVYVNTGSELLIDEVTLTVADGGKINNRGTIDVDGTLYVTIEKTGISGNGTIESDVVSRGEQDVRYTTLANAIAAAGLDLIYCVEPIGPEHTYGQIAREILRARDYHVDIMACMRRVAVPGTPLYEKGEISDLELAKIVAVTRIAANPKISMNVHEPNAVAMLAGVNQLYAETGSNPRDKEIDTRENRGYSIERARQMLEQYGYTR